MVFIKRLTIGLVGCALIGVGCFTKPRVTPVTTPLVAAPEESLMAMAPTVVEAKERLTFLDPFHPKKGENVLEFTLKDAEGRPLGADELLLEQEKKMHAIIVKDDLSGFQHLHPQFNRSVWSLPVTLPEAGKYRLYLDYTPVQGKRTVLFLPFVIPGTSSPKSLPNNSASHVAKNDAITARLLDAPPTFVAGTTTQLIFELGQGVQAVQEIGPYLGAFGHVVILQQEKPQAYLHVHPLTDRQPKDGRVVFETRFPEPGHYVVYGQFNIAGVLRVFPMTIEVGTAPVAPVSTSTTMMPVMLLEHRP